MNLIDLEMYRWRFHNDIYIHTVKKWRPDNRPMMTWSRYWNEYGAFVSVLPKHIKLEKMLAVIAKTITKQNSLCGDYRIIVSGGTSITPNLGIDFHKVYSLHSVKKNKLDILHHSDIHLMVDNFDLVNKKQYKEILNYQWKSVTIVSSLRNY